MIVRRYKFTQAGKAVFDLFHQRGFDAIINDDLIGNVLSFAALGVGTPFDSCLLVSFLVANLVSCYTRLDLCCHWRTFGGIHQYR